MHRLQCRKRSATDNQLTSYHAYNPKPSTNLFSPISIQRHVNLETLNTLSGCHTAYASGESIQGFSEDYQMNVVLIPLLFNAYALTILSFPT
ncbi:hypothetical protein AOQ84DRAFT_104101 [Glonium stellatum]|uniref:Uncharacterized protein n=1 Tax=Glonium stellatum TaxID=574774 RepID=A0A8E2EUX3_9PEZI|nr:hypothetical protein AOQ84DRAFT_104101 [Glonium stellatum]